MGTSWRWHLYPSSPGAGGVHQAACLENFPAVGSSHNQGQVSDSPCQETAPSRPYNQGYAVLSLATGCRGGVQAAILPHEDRVFARLSRAPRVMAVAKVHHQALGKWDCLGPATQGLGQEPRGL
jgi:hypothetical protein